MYSGQEFIDNQDHLYMNSQRNSFNQPPYSMHNRQSNHNSFGPMAIHNNSVQNYTDSSATWFGTSLDSNASSYGGRDLIITPSNSTGHNIDNYTSVHDDDEFNQKNHQEIFEKRRRRRESHNAVERRRRDNINERILELSTLLPDHLLESVPASANVMTVTTGQSGVNGKPINKGTILKLSVDHIKELRDQVSKCKNRIQELENLVEMTTKQGSNHLIHNNAHYIGSRQDQFQQKFGKLQITNNNNK